jgi:integrase
MRISFKVKYIFKHGSQYIYQRSVPKDLRPHFGKSKISIPLGTRNLAEASKLAAVLADRDTQSFQTLRNGNVSGASALAEMRDLYSADNWVFPEPVLNVFNNQASTLGIQGDDLARATIDSVLEGIAESGNRLAASALELGSTLNDVFLSDSLEINFKIEGVKATNKRRKDVTRSVNLLIDIAGDKPIHQYTRSDARAFRDYFIERSKISTGKRNRNNLQGLFTRIYEELDIDKPSPFLGLRWPTDSATKARPPFSMGELNAIQTSCYFLDDDIRWIVGLLADTGCRLSEIIGLAAEDVKVTSPIPHLIIQPHPWRRLKSESSRRQVPLIGSSLWGAGRALSRAEGLTLFSRYCSTNQCKSTYAGNTINKYLKPFSDGKGTHSFRHLMSDRLRDVGCPEDVIASVLGHSRATITSRYGSGHNLQTLNDWMTKLRG